MNNRFLLYILLGTLFLIAGAYQARFIERRLQYLTSPDSFVANQLTASRSGEIVFVADSAQQAFFTFIGMKMGTAVNADARRSFAF